MHALRHFVAEIEGGGALQGRTQPALDVAVVGPVHHCIAAGTGLVIGFWGCQQAPQGLIVGGTALVRSTPVTMGNAARLGNRPQKPILGRKCTIARQRRLQLNAATCSNLIREIGLQHFDVEIVLNRSLQNSYGSLCRLRVRQRQFLAALPALHSVPLPHGIDRLESELHRALRDGGEDRADVLGHRAQPPVHDPELEIGLGHCPDLGSNNSARIHVDHCLQVSEGSEQHDLTSPFLRGGVHNRKTKRILVKRPGTAQAAPL
mmetsp:Transcript_16006/g.40644  ORF Transcript_16006/g.40644 Transcript_16006/m.40644 type:complete len:262 (+) Transcript_16006:1315-2100(+)